MAEFIHSCHPPMWENWIIFWLPASPSFSGHLRREQADGRTLTLPLSLLSLINENAKCF